MSVAAPPGSPGRLGDVPEHWPPWYKNDPDGLGLCIEAALERCPPPSPHRAQRASVKARLPARTSEKGVPPVADSASELPVIYQHPLAYLLGLEGVALLRAFSGTYDREFTRARFDEIRELLNSLDAFGTGIEARPISTREGYDRWAPSYDEPGNQLLDIEQPVVREILDRLPVGIALDAACGTGRHAAYLASLGHTVIGVDSSPGMLSRAREKIPHGEFYEADLHELPLADDSVDLVVCAIALVHVPNIAGPFVEFARVL